MDWFLYDNGLRHERVKVILWAKRENLLIRQANQRIMLKLPAHIHLTTASVLKRLHVFDSDQLRFYLKIQTFQYNIIYSLHLHIL